MTTTQQSAAHQMADGTELLVTLTTIHGPERLWRSSWTVERDGQLIARIRPTGHDYRVLLADGEVLGSSPTLRIAIRRAHEATC